MEDIKAQLRQVLAQRAEAAPAAVDLGAASRARARRHRFRRRAVAACLGIAGVFALVVGVTTVPALLRGSGPVTHPGGSPSPSATLDGPRIRYAPATAQPTLTFPYTPGFVPDGLPPAGVRRTQTTFLMHQRQREDDRFIKVEVLAAAPTEPPPGLEGAAGQSVPVRGHTGTLTATTDTTGPIQLTWPEKAGQWLNVQSVGVTRADLLRYANELRAQAISGTEAFHFTILPVGLDTIYETIHWNLTLVAPGATSPDTGPVVSLVVTLEAPPPTFGTPVQVGPHAGRIESGRDGLRLAIELGNGAVLEVYSSPGSTEADLVSFGAGITVDLDRI
jgi:hypothetical protein